MGALETAGARGDDPAVTMTAHAPACREHPPAALMQAGDGSAWFRFAAPRRIVRADAIADVLPALAEVEAANAAGLWAAGFVAYDAAPAFDAALAVHPSAAGPLLWFGLFDEPARLPASWRPPAGPPPRIDWRPSVSAAAHACAVEDIRGCIARGETYQVNLTHRLRAAAPDDPFALFTAMVRAQRGRHAAWIDTGDLALASASPELFFALDDTRIVSRPMKGTAPRGRNTALDRRIAAALAASPKDRAENLMIVDMVRNDLGRIAAPGSVHVPRLYEVERYPTVWQMTSTVTATTHVPLAEIFRALFPAASITGAPKVQATRIIARLEDSPRDVYTGCIGWSAPGRRAEFNVAIRTACIDRRAGSAVYGTGGGIVWDSSPTAEFEECRTKAQVLFETDPPFSLLETMLWQPRRGFRLLDLHLARLADSADYFDIPLDPAAMRRALDAAAAGWPPRPHRVRLLVDADGTPSVEAAPFDPRAERRTWRLAPAAGPVDSADRFLRHKTTRRSAYDHARAARPGFDDVILWNERGEITESTLANVAVRIDGAWITPAASCGLLRGTMRERLLRRGTIREGIVLRDDLSRAGDILLFNSLRGWIRTALPAADGPDG